MGFGVEGDGKTLNWFGFGGLSFGSEGGGCKSLIAPTCSICSRGGNLASMRGNQLFRRLQELLRGRQQVGSGKLEDHTCEWSLP